MELLAGAVVARLAYEVPVGDADALAHGVAGATVGVAAGRMLMGMLGRPLSGFQALPEEVELAQSDQLAPPSDEVVIDSGSFAEAEMLPEFGGTAEEDVPLGSWVG